MGVKKRDDFSGFQGFLRFCDTWQFTMAVAESPQDCLSGFPVSELLVSAPKSSSLRDELLGKVARSSETGNPLNQSCGDSQKK